MRRRCPPVHEGCWLPARWARALVTSAPLSRLGAQRSREAACALRPAPPAFAQAAEGAIEAFLAQVPAPLLEAAQAFRVARAQSAAAAAGGM
jgi:hypothetical protein